MILTYWLKERPCSVCANPQVNWQILLLCRHESWIFIKLLDRMLWKGYQATSAGPDHYSFTLFSHWNGHMGWDFAFKNGYTEEKLVECFNQWQSTDDPPSPFLSLPRKIFLLPASFDSFILSILPKSSIYQQDWGVWVSESGLFQRSLEASDPRADRLLVI